MSIREITGLVLIIVSVIIAPFFYWISIKYLYVAFFFVIIGGPLFYTARVMRKEEESLKERYGNSISGHIPPIGEARGFGGFKGDSSFGDDGFDGD